MQLNLQHAACRFYWMGLRTESWPEFIYSNPELLENGGLRAQAARCGGRGREGGARPCLIRVVAVGGESLVGSTPACEGVEQPSVVHTGAAGGLPYEHWGRIFLPDGGPEPNNRAGNEYCAGANYTERYDGAWAWSDEPCLTKAPYICRLKRDTRLAGA
jgi:hypothetical protein